MENIIDDKQEYALIDDIDELNKSAKVSDLPTEVEDQFKKLSELRSNVLQADQNARESELSAKDAEKIKVHWYTGTTDAIEALQNATVKLATAQISTAEALELTFLYQKKIAVMAKNLFALGCMNIAANRTVVRELQLKLENASQEELDELSRQELENTLKQLKAQQDIMFKVEKYGEFLKQHELRLNELNNQIEKSQILKDKRFLNSTFYKISIGIIAISSLVCSLIL